MKSRYRLTFALVLIATLLSFSVMAPYALSAPPFQADPTEQQQTIGAVVNQFFTQTAEVDQLLGATQTIEAAFNQAQTGTAAFQTAIYDSFNQALTATDQASLEARSNELGLEPITTANAHQLVELMRLGEGNIRAMSWSPPGDALMVVSSIGVRIYDGRDLTLVSTFLSDDTVRAVFNPDGTRLASASNDGTIRLWDRVTGGLLFVLQGHEDLVHDIAFSPDGTRLIAEGGGIVQQWDTATGAELAILQQFTFNAGKVKFSPDGKYLALGGGTGLIGFLDLQSGRLTVLQGHSFDVRHLVFSPDGKYLASASSDGTVRLWDTATGTQLHAMTGNGECMAFSPDGRVLASGSDDGTVLLWDSDTGATLIVLQANEGGVTSVAFSPNKFVLASAGFEGTIRIWGVLHGDRAAQATATAAMWTPSPTPPPTLTQTVTPTWTPTLKPTTTPTGTPSLTPSSTASFTPNYASTLSISAEETIGNAWGITSVTVGTNAEYPPFEFMDATGNLIGFDVDIMNTIAQRVGFEIEWVNTRWDGIFVALASGEFDCVASAATITNEREEIVDFSDPYFNAGQMIAVRKDRADDIRSAEDLPGLKIGVQGGTTGDITASEIDGVEVVRYDEITLAFQALANGTIDAIVNDGPVSADIIMKNPGLGIVLVGDPISDEFYGIAVRSDRTAVREAINAGLAAIIADGTYNALHVKWLGIEAPTMFQPAQQ